MAEPTKMDVALDASIEGGEGATQGDNPLNWDADAIVTGAASASAAAVCAAYGAPVAAPLCGAIAGAVTTWALDNVVGPVGEFFGSLFSGQAPESLIERQWSEFFESGEALAWIEDWALYGYGGPLAQQHNEYRLPGDYGLQGAMAAIKDRAGVAVLPNTVTVYDSWGKPAENRSVRVPPNFPAAFRAYWRTVPYSAKFPERRERVYSGRGSVTYETTRGDARLSLFDAWFDREIKPWQERFMKAAGDEARFLAEQGIAHEAVRAAQSEMGGTSTGVLRLRTGDSPRRMDLNAALDKQKALIAAKEKRAGTVKALVTFGAIGGAVGLGWWLWKGKGRRVWGRVA